MLEIIRNEIERFKTGEEKYNHLRECLQVLLLKIVYEGGFFRSLAFTGGTAMRIVFGLRRFSEDLDFSLIQENGYNFGKATSYVRRQLGLLNLDAEISAGKEGNVHKIDCKFEDVLFETGLSAFQAQKLMIRLEIDTNPPGGYKVETSLVNRMFMFTVNHFDLPSLFSCKIHTCLFRRYTKGRDFYDLLWFLGKKVKPNLKVLNNAIAQTEKNPAAVNEENFREFLLEGLERVDFGRVRKDVERFVEDKKELDLLNRETITKLI